MIELFRKQNCYFCDEIEEEIKELVISHEVIYVEKDTDFPKEIPLPAVKDDGKIISGYEEIRKYINDLKKFVELWRKYQVDACYIDDDGEVC
jgi:uncharacterized protein YozE (UPF0346 family)